MFKLMIPGKTFTKMYKWMQSFSAPALTSAGPREAHSVGRGQSEHARDGNEWAVDQGELAKSEVFLKEIDHVN